MFYFYFKRLVITAWIIVFILASGVFGDNDVVDGIGNTFAGISTISTLVLLFFLGYRRFRINILSIRDIQGCSSSIKIIRNKAGFYGVSFWEEKGARLLLKMQYSNIARINDDTFTCTRDGLHGVYNATKKKMLIPVTYESIKLQDGKIVATRGGVVSVFTDRGYRVVE